MQPDLFMSICTSLRMRAFSARNCFAAEATACSAMPRQRVETVVVPEQIRMLIHEHGRARQRLSYR